MIDDSEEKLVLELLAKVEADRKRFPPGPWSWGQRVEPVDPEAIGMTARGARAKPRRFRSPPMKVARARGEGERRWAVLGVPGLEEGEVLHEVRVDILMRPRESAVVRLSRLLYDADVVAQEGRPNVRSHEAIASATGITGPDEHMVVVTLPALAERAELGKALLLVVERQGEGGGVAAVQVWVA